MTDKFITTPEVKEYLDIARQFCDYIESNNETTSIEFLKNVRPLLLTLYQKALVFPLYNGDSDEDTEDLLGDAYFTVLQLIQSRVGEMNYYTHIYDPTKLDDENPVGGLLSDDLGDIYRDIKRALLQIDTGSDTARAHALWSLHFLFRNHYGEHIINGLYSIHFFLQDQ